MASAEEANTRSGSTTWGWKRVKISPTAGGQRARVAKPPRWYKLPRRDPRQPLSITVSYRGGQECWYEVHARGSIGRFPGHVALHDVMSEITRSSGS